MACISTCISLKPSLFLKPSRHLHSHHHHHHQIFQTKPYFRDLSIGGRTRVYGPVVRAGLDIPIAVKPGGSVESDSLPSDVRNRGMAAVDACGGRVTIGDVSSRGGLKLNEAQKALQALASDADGFLEVSDEGDVLYVFPKDYRSKLATKSFKIKVEPWIEKAKCAVEYLIRVSFGTVLIASIVLVFTAIIVILSSSKRSGRGRRSSSRSYNPQSSEGGGGGMNFIESVFSFVFGDGDPNEGIEEERWKLIGQYIASNGGGVVTAEELAPFLDVQSEEVDESYVLPVLLRFDGQPEVDEEGNILYRFPSLQRTAAARQVGGVERLFKERELEFSKTNISERAMVIGLGGLNLFGVIVLGTMLRNMPPTTPPSGFLSFVTHTYPLLQIYAGSFFAIPLFRLFFLLKRNAEIGKRNRERELRSKAVESPDVSLRRKILSARDMARRTVIGQDRIVYSTDRDLFEQNYDSQDWEQRFREVEKSD